MAKSNNLEHFLESLDSEYRQGFGNKDIYKVTVDVQDDRKKSVRKQSFDNFKDASDYIYDKLEPGYSVVLSVN